MKKSLTLYAIGPLLIIFVIGIAGFGFWLTRESKNEETSKPKLVGTESSVFEKAADFIKADPYHTLPDTGQNHCYNNTSQIECPSKGQSFYGQDAQYLTNTPRFEDLGNGAIVDTVTKLTWQKDFKFVSWENAFEEAEKSDVGGYSDWRVPSIKEMYSLIDFSGNTGGGVSQSELTVPEDAVPFIDTNFFDFEYGQVTRFIDAQYMSSTEYVATTMGGNDTIFGVNFADGRIKGYPKSGNRSTGKFYLRLVRGKDFYGVNRFVDNEDGTITDEATNLVWTKEDSKKDMNWLEALNYCENLKTNKYDWRLPNAKELQGIVDYTRSPDTTNSPAIDPIFEATEITNENGQVDFPMYWTSTTHSEGSGNKGAYVAFGRAMGYMNGQWVDVHGAGAQRSDPKTGSASSYPTGHGPQGDAIRIDNYARCVRGGATINKNTSEPVESLTQSPIQGVPPQEAQEACSGKSEGNSCSFKTPKNIVSGTCRNIGSVTACAPVDGPPQ